MWLGHDGPEWPVDESWIFERREHLLIHAKNFGGAIEGVHAFAHTFQPFVFTSRGLIWVHDLELVPNERCIVPLIDLWQFDYKHRGMGGICTDWPERARKHFS